MRPPCRRRLYASPNKSSRSRQFQRNDVFASTRLCWWHYFFLHLPTIINSRRRTIPREDEHCTPTVFQHSTSSRGEQQHSSTGILDTHGRLQPANNSNSSSTVSCDRAKYKWAIMSACIKSDCTTPAMHPPHGDPPYYSYTAPQHPGCHRRTGRAIDDPGCHRRAPRSSRKMVSAELTSMGCCRQLGFFAAARLAAALAPP